MRRWMTTLALLTPALAQGVEEQEIPKDEIIGIPEEVGEEGAPEVAPAKLDTPAGVVLRAERDAPTVFVRVREGGVLQMKSGEEWKDVALEDVARRLKEFADEQDREMRKAGKSAFGRAPGGTKVSCLFLSIDAEPTVPWQHVQWLMTTAAEQKYYKLEIGDGKKRFLVTLPIDPGLPPGAEPPLAIKIPVHALAVRETPQKWGDTQVNRPTEIRFKIGNDETVEIAPVSEFVKKAWTAVKDTPGASIAGEIKAGHKVPTARILDLMEVFVTSGFARVDFYGTEVPTAALRTAQRLPFPLQNYPTD